MSARRSILFLSGFLMLALAPVAAATGAAGVSTHPAMFLGAYVDEAPKDAQVDHTVEVRRPGHDEHRTLRIVTTRPGEEQAMTRFADTLHSPLSIEGEAKDTKRLFEVPEGSWIEGRFELVGSDRLVIHSLDQVLKPVRGS